MIDLDTKAKAAEAYKRPDPSGSWCGECDECHRVTFHPYMIEQEIWDKVMPTFKGHLHIWCLEKRLGRRVTREDFAQRVPLNDFVFFLLDR